MLSFTPSERLTDPQGRPYFLWDCDLTLAQFQMGLQDADPDVRAYLVGKLMRQAKPDDVFLFVRPRMIRELWPRLRPYLGKTREFWTWLFETPRWTLTGGGALAGVHLGHRETRDLDLFWRNRAELGPLVPAAVGALRADGIETHVLRTSPAFGELRASVGDEACIVDLVAEPFGSIEPPDEAVIDGAAIAVDSRREILASKLAALLERSEVRDLVDVRALLDAGGDLEAGLRDAPRKDAGFSPLTLAWVLKGFDVVAAARALGWSQDEARGLAAFRVWLIERLTAAAAPDPD
ncbi:MAG TPA: nucleotidyl transferase AbiEii/AbiGii toxin family protein [Vicinamibacteria bacterium]|nr:nucleotidyl transferase AbiEii/AbiGii toxin family protein [Vicinamibacteria bacterium]